MINGICGGGENARSESVLIEGCTMSGIRGHAIQLYKLRMNVTVKDCKINSWGVNAQTAAGTATDAAVRGTIESSTGSLTLSSNFAQTEEGRWVEENAHRFGFIIRYKAEWKSMTGYNYEPWHIRYLGKELAK